ncbi:hypothetical protein QLQ12_37410 [Actinoplanes sp. NEAU-A12]|uniref:Fibronectin type-III domain-containing protein n=1 Tax=Actinoplanes sandaracinus TaxID=3045177 RepID=A0ABT6WXF5_9ACTN|nr:hypothetical protein [Actinoplanes sandaracinus]
MARRASVLLLAATAVLLAAATPAAAAGTTAPGAPDGVSAEGNGPLSVYWATAPNDDDVTAYRVYRNGQQLATVPGDATSYHDHALTGSTWYTYGVQAVDAAGNASPVVSAPPVTSAPLPALPHRPQRHGRRRAGGEQAGAGRLRRRPAAAMP